MFKWLFIFLSLQQIYLFSQKANVQLLSNLNLKEVKHLDKMFIKITNIITIIPISALTDLLLIKKFYLWEAIINFTLVYFKNWKIL